MILNPKSFKTHVYNTSYHLHYLYTIQKSIQPWSIFHLLSTLIQKNNPENIFFTFFVIIHCDECEQHRIPAFQLFAQYVSLVKSTH